MITGQTATNPFNASDQFLDVCRDTMTISLAISTQYMSVTNKQTERQTPADGQYRPYSASRGDNPWVLPERGLFPSFHSSSPVLIYRTLASQGTVAKYLSTWHVSARRLQPTTISNTAVMHTA